MAVIPTLSLYIGDRFGMQDPDEVEFWTAVTFGVAPLMAAFAGPFWGTLADRMGRKPMVLRSTIAIAVATALMPMADTPLGLVGLRALQGLFAGYIAPAMALVSYRVPSAQQGRVISYLQVGLAGGLLFGPWFGAEIVEWTGDRRWVFWMCSIAALVGSFPVLLLAREDPPERPPGRPGLLRDVVLRFGEMLNNRVFVGLLLLLIVLRLGIQMPEPFLALLVQRLGPQAILGDADVSVDRATAWLFMLPAVISLVLTPVWGRLADRYGPLACLGWSALALATIHGLLAQVASYPGLFFLRIPAAVFTVATMTLAYAAAGKRVHAGRRTLAFSMVQSCTQLGLAFGPFLGERALRTVGEASDDGLPPDLRSLFPLSAALLGIAGIGMLLLRRRPPTPLPPPAPD